VFFQFQVINNLTPPPGCGQCQENVTPGA
jgi:hypothetical protein